MTLIDRLSKLDGPDREVDAEIDRAFGLNVDIGALTGPWTDYPKPGHYRETSRYTASLDAAIALAERVLPGWKRQLLEDFNGKWIARVCSQRRELFSTDYLRETELGGSPNAAIALCIAILRAKEAMHGE